MAPRDDVDPLERISSRYGTAQSIPGVWDAVKKLVDAGKPKAAMQYARDAIASADQKTQNRHAGAVASRKAHQDMLRAQKATEGQIRAILRVLGDKAERLLARNEKDGVIPPARLRRVLLALNDLNRESYREISKLIRASLRDAIRRGIQGANASALAMVQSARKFVGESQHGRDFLKMHLLESGLRYDLMQCELREISQRDIQRFLLARRIKNWDPTNPQMVKQAAEWTAMRSALNTLFRGTKGGSAARAFGIKPGTGIYKKVFTGTKKTTMLANVFGPHKLSNRVWDLRDQNFLAMKRMVTNGVANAKTAAGIGRDIRGVLGQPSTIPWNSVRYADMRPGAGVYKSARANAERLTRTETSRAYAAADANVAQAKGWMVVWRKVPSFGKASRCICNDLDNTEMTPEDFKDKHPAHPHCCPGPTIVSPCGDISHVYKRRYIGRMAVIETSGHSLTITINHPVLTRRGWVPAGEVLKGDMVACASDSKSGWLYENAHAPTCIEDTVERYLMDSNVRISKSLLDSDDFHGDARYGECSIVGHVSIPSSTYQPKDYSTDVALGDGGEVIYEPVTCVGFIDYDGLVFNLETSRHMYWADGIIVKNCMCYPEKVIDGLS